MMVACDGGGRRKEANQAITAVVSTGIGKCLEREFTAYGSSDFEAGVFGRL